MGRLIDADALKKDLKSVTLSNGTLVNTNAVLHLLEEYPTAYDVDKVVEQLEELKKQNPFINGIRDNSIEAAASRQTLDYAIDIVKAGARQ